MNKTIAECNACKKALESKDEEHRVAMVDQADKNSAILGSLKNDHAEEMASLVSAQVEAENALADTKEQTERAQAMIKRNTRNPAR